MAKRKGVKPQRSGGELLPAVDKTADMLEAGALVSSAFPVLGTAISHVLTGWSRERQHERIREVINLLDEQLRATQVAISEDYVRSDEFEDLLDQTLRRVAQERHEEKRRVYAAFLRGAIQDPGHPYHEQLRFLRTLEELQPDHVRIIQAMRQDPGNPAGYISGSIRQTLMRRLPDMPEARLIDLYGQLVNELHLVQNTSLMAMMTSAGAEDLRRRFAEYGARLVSYIGTAP